MTINNHKKAVTYSTSTFPRSWIEISSSAFSHNIGIIESLTSDYLNVGISLKANAYGHGLATLGQLAQQDNRIKSLYVSNAESARILHAAGVTKNIIIHDAHQEGIIQREDEALCYGLRGSSLQRITGKTDCALKPLLAWKTKIMRTKKVSSHTPVGYARSFITTRPTVIGILPLGYADGLPRLLSNKGTVIIRGIQVPIIGLISMNLTAIDLTDIEGVSHDDDVTVFAADNLPMMADLASCTDIELVSRLHNRIPRFIVPAFFDEKYVLPHQQSERFF